MDGTQFEEVSQFRYLGDILEGNGGCEIAVSRRLRAGWVKFRELAGVVAAKDIPHHLKGLIYKTCIRPVALYGCETWPMRIEEEKRLQRMERKMLRWMAGDKKMEEQEFRKLLGVEDLAMVMRKSRLRWLGHVERREEEAWIKKIQKLDVQGGSRPKGRPRMSWSQVIERDLRAWKMKREEATDRKRWRERLSDAMREVDPQVL